MHKSTHKFFLSLFLVFFLGMFFLPFLFEPASAADPYVLKQPIGNVTSLTFDGSTRPIAEYIEGIYKYSIGVVAILATVVMMIGGLVWMTAAGSQTRISEAKQYITGALTGMVLVLCSYMILNTINPDLVNIKPIKIKRVEQIIMGCCEKNEVNLGQTTSDKCDGNWGGAGSIWSPLSKQCIIDTGGCCQGKVAAEHTNFRCENVQSESDCESNAWSSILYHPKTACSQIATCPNNTVADTCSIENSGTSCGQANQNKICWGENGCIDCSPNVMGGCSGNKICCQGFCCNGVDCVVGPKASPTNNICASVAGTCDGTNNGTSCGDSKICSGGSCISCENNLNGWCSLSVCCEGMCCNENTFPDTCIAGTPTNGKYCN